MWSWLSADNKTLARNRNNIREGKSPARKRGDMRNLKILLFATFTSVPVALTHIAQSSTGSRGVLRLGSFRKGQ